MLRRIFLILRFQNDNWKIISSKESYETTGSSGSATQDFFNPAFSKHSFREKSVRRNRMKQPVPADFIQEASIRIPTHPDENSFSNNMIFRNKSPKA